MTASNTPIHALTQEQYESLPRPEYVAVRQLLCDIQTGHVHPATSYNDLTPAQLAEEMGL